MKQTSVFTRNLAHAQELAQLAKNERPVQSRTSDNLSVRYRIYTERFENLAHLVSLYFNGATLLDAIGLWQGVSENSTVIEVIGTRAIVDDILALAEDICSINNQSEVLITSEPVKRYSVTRSAL